MCPVHIHPKKLAYEDCGGRSSVFDAGSIDLHVSTRSSACAQGNLRAVEGSVFRFQEAFCWMLGRLAASVSRGTKKAQPGYSFFLFLF